MSEDNSINNFIPIIFITTWMYNSEWYFKYVNQFTRQIVHNSYRRITDIKDPISKFTNGSDKLNITYYLQPGMVLKVFKDSLEIAAYNTSGTISLNLPEELNDDQVVFDLVAYTETEYTPELMLVYNEHDVPFDLNIPPKPPLEVYNNNLVIVDPGYGYNVGMYHEYISKFHVECKMAYHNKVLKIYTKYQVIVGARKSINISTGIYVSSSTDSSYIPTYIITPRAIPTRRKYKTEEDVEMFKKILSALTVKDLTRDEVVDMLIDYSIDTGTCENEIKLLTNYILNCTSDVQVRDYIRIKYSNGYIRYTDYQLKELVHRGELPFTIYTIENGEIIVTINNPFDNDIIFDADDEIGRLITLGHLQFGRVLNEINLDGSVNM